MDCMARRTRSSKLLLNHKPPPPPPPETPPAATIIIVDKDDTDVSKDYRVAEESEPTALQMSKDCNTNGGIFEKVPCVASCVAKRTRLQMGFLPRVSYTEFFKRGAFDYEQGMGSEGWEKRGDFRDQSGDFGNKLMKKMKKTEEGLDDDWNREICLMDFFKGVFFDYDQKMGSEGWKSRADFMNKLMKKTEECLDDDDGNHEVCLMDFFKGWVFYYEQEMGSEGWRNRAGFRHKTEVFMNKLMKKTEECLDDDGNHEVCLIDHEQELGDEALKKRAGFSHQNEVFMNRLMKKRKKTEEGLMSVSSEGDEDGDSKVKGKNGDEKDINSHHELVQDEEIEGDYPLLFSFDDGDAKVMEKTEFDEELDELWSEFDFVLQCINVGSYGDDELQEDIHCSGGDHQFVLDEQIGIICKLCSFVDLEIKYVLPSLAKNSTKSSANNTSAAATTINHVFAQLKTESNFNNCEITPTGTVWDHIPGVHQTLYPHQIEAFEFIWRNLAGSISLQELKNSVPRNTAGGGCIISHAPGTGKSRLAIVFIQSFLKQFPNCRPVIISPRGMLLTWENEFKKWKANISFHNLNTKDFSKGNRWGKLCSWKRGDGVLAVSYNLFTKLIAETQIAGKFLLNQPGLIVFDEGHTPRNDRSLVWKALEKVETLNRIGLSGTLFQNNLRELSNTMQLVRPGFGNLIDKKKKTIVIDDAKISEIRSAIKPFVHVHGGAILETLPGLRECLILLNPPEIQRIVIDNLNNRSSFDVHAEHKLCMASIHPSLLTSVKLTETERSVLDLNLLNRLRSNPDEGVKTKFVIELVRLSEALNEKVLVFCQYVEPLAMLKKQLTNVFKWSNENRVLQIDGSVSSKSRQSLIEVFNDSASEAMVLLASTRACGEGITLVGASRIVLLDVLWNPAVERQAISRAYRIGQVRVVYTYQLILNGTGERERYMKQVGKDQMSEMLFSIENDEGDAEVLSKSVKERAGKLILEDRVLEEMIGNEEMKEMFIKLHFP